MEFFSPVKRVVDEVGHDLDAAEIIDRRVPVGMETLTWIGVLIECGAIEPAKSMFVGREMCGNPVQQNADANFVSAIDEAGKPFGIAKTCTWGVETRRLVTPGRVIGMFRNRQELDMGEAHIRTIGNELGGELVPT